ncbi:MAG: AhpC/TSA family protein [Alistipes sp.]|nr:AhpC/TSA family protein [Alistipes sp.]
MKKILTAAAVAAVFMICGCKSSTVKISGRLLGLNAKSVYLEQVSSGGEKLIDSVALGEDGTYAFRLNDVSSTPSLYNIVYNGERIPLLLVGGERVTVNSVGSLLRNYTVQGSGESELLRRFNKAYVEGLERMNIILERFSGNSLSSAERDALMKEYTNEYRKAKREQLKFIVENKDKIAAIYALYQRFPGEKFLFSNDGDIIYYRTVADAVEQSCPDSPFLPTLRTEIARMDARITLMSQIAEANYPDISLPDMYGKEVRLSSLGGKVILLWFWSAATGNSNALNAELKHTYGKYADKGFEIYQVSVDTSKALWINAVQEQRLDWISVCDLRGERSPFLGTYNVGKLPANFLIDTNGSIVGKDLYGKELDDKLAELLH